MKIKKDTATGIIGLLGVAFFAIMAQSIKLIPNAQEPGTRIFPYFAMAIIALSSLGLIISSIRSNEPTKKYFSEGGVKRAAFGFLLAVVYGVGLTYLGFLISTPFATAAFIWTLKGQAKVKPWVLVVISLAVTAVLYGGFVYGFQIKLPSGIFF